MSLAVESIPIGVIRRIFRREEKLTDSASPDTEGVIRTGGVDSSFPPEPQELKIRIIGSRDIRTGEILPCHQEIHDTYLELKPLELGQPVTIE